MNYQIIQLDEFAGTMARIYSILPEGEDMTMLDKFVEEYSADYPDEILCILDLLEAMSYRFGVREHLVKLNEGSPGDGVVALFDNPDKKLRLYGIRYGNGIIILGGGGVKPKQIKAYQENSKLNEEVNIIKSIGKDIYQRILIEEINICTNGIEFIGNLIFKEDEND